MTPDNEEQGEKNSSHIFIPMRDFMVVKLLAEYGFTVATAESCTGGLLAKKITDIPGASEAFEMGLITYANRIKTQLLHIPEEVLAEYGAVSEQVASLMAINVRELADSDFGIGITGIAGPDGGSEEKPVGLVYICVADRDHVWQEKMLPEDKDSLRKLSRYEARKLVRENAVSYALDLLLDAMLELRAAKGLKGLFDR